MEVVVRTPHGTADVSIRERPTDDETADGAAGDVGGDDDETADQRAATLGDVLALTTGQATPRVARVDGTVVETTALIGDVARDGSTIETDPTMPGSPPHGTRWLVAVAGPGTGRSLELDPGTYRIGPGRRMRADELSEAVVDVPAAEFEVVSDGDARLRPADPALGAHVADVELEDEQLWPLDTPERPAPPLVIGDRAFVLRSEPADAGDWTGWRRRDPSSPLEVPIGIVEARLDGSPLGGSYSEATLDLHGHPVVAVSSDDAESRQAMLRTIALSAARARRPLELDIAVVTEPSELAVWDWAKWLPHVRVRDDVQILADDADVSAWLDERRATPSKRTLLIIDAVPELASAGWSLRSTIADPPPDLIVVVGVDTPAAAPSSTSVEIQLQSASAAAVIGDTEQARLLPALIDFDVAADGARALARDGARERLIGDPDEHAGPDLLELVTGGGDRPWEVAIGRDAGGAVSVELSGGVIEVVSTRFGPIADVAAAIVAGACLQHPPEDVWVIDAARASEPSSLDAIRHLPHVVLSDAAPSTFDRRLLARLDHLLHRDHAPQRVLVVAADGEDLHDAAALDALRRVHDGVVVLALRQRPLHDAAAALNGRSLNAHTRIRVADQVGRRVATIAVGDHAPHRFAPYQPRRPIRRWPEIAPFTAGRPLTPLERRLQRQDEASSTTPPDLARVVQLIGDASAPIADRPTIAPRPLPAELDAARLRGRAPGDGVPIGVIDRPDKANAVVWWWVPGDGSLLFVGAIRSGVRRVLRTLADGIAERCSPDDVAVAAVVATASTKRAYSALPHAIAVADRTNPDEILEFVERLETTIADGGPPTPRIVVVIDDVGWTRATLRTDADRRRFDGVLAATVAPDPVVDVVATATTIDDAGALVDADRRAIGQLGDPDEGFRLAVPHELDANPIAGRCWLLPHETLGQLAAAGALDQRRSDGEPVTTDRPVDEDAADQWQEQDGHE